jgi:tRNA 2-thiouridine synthesizing protein B
MTILHLVRRSAFETHDFAQCIANIATGDVIVLIDDGCYNLQHALLSQAQAKLSVDGLCALQEHAKARALVIKQGVKAIDMQALLGLTFSLDTVMTWQ